MCNEKTYKLSMTTTGRITQLPDSQKIFGAFTYWFADQVKQETTAELIKGIKSGKEHLTLSNILPKGYLHMPQEFLLDQISERNDQDSAKQLYKAIKKRQFVEKEQLSAILNDPSQSQNCYPYAATSSRQQIHVSLESFKFDLPGLDPNLYSLPEIYIEEHTNTDSVSMISQFDIYLSMHESDLMNEFMQTLQAAIMKQHRFFIGPRASQGFNTFLLKELQEIHITSNSSYYLNLGMLLPSKIEYETSYIKLFTSERRPYEIADGWNQYTAKQYISFIAAGSIIHSHADTKEMLRSIPSPFDERAIVFGNAFLLPVTLGGN